MSAIKRLSRREVLRGALGGMAVTVGLPLLECFLNESGSAYALGGGALPPCFGTWFWGLGLIPDHWEPKETGTQYTLPDHISVLAPIQPKINLFSGMQVFLDGKVNQNHYSGAQCQATGVVSRTGSEYTTSIDTIIGDQIGKRSRFRSLEVSCDGDRRATWSARGSNGMNPAEVSPLALYSRIFGSEFKDPNAATFEPDPSVMVRHSVLTAVADQRQDLMSKVSAADKARLDEYFSSIRDLEQQFAIELQRPSPLPSCTVPPRMESETIGSLVSQTRKTHQQFVTLIAHALSCGQTQVFNIAMGSAFSKLRADGEVSGYHQLTHEEPIDPKLGYQVKCKTLAEQQMEFFRQLVQTLDSVREGDSTLLDRSVVFGFTDHGEARMHSMKRYPILTAGSGGGRMKTGYHIAAEGDAATRVGLTIQQALGISAGSWGTETNRATKPFSEILV
jgi:Protein of unknown function (DUF1552)